jgi:WD40 repeat protein
MIVVADKAVKIWDAVTGHVKAALKGHSHYVTSVAISHDGATIVSGSGE